VLTLTLHHQAGDGVSLGVLARDLAQAYGGGALAPLAVQYSDWAAWQQASLAESLPAKIARARDRLRGMPDSLTLPLDHPRLADRARRAGVHELVLPPPLVMCLDALARAAGTTLFTVVLAAFGATLSRLAGQQDVVIGSPVAGRGRIETDGLIGFFVNTLALPVSLGGAITGQDLIARARASVEAALIDQDLPFERLVEELGVARSLAHTPVFQAMLAFQTQGEAALTLPGLTVTPLPVRLPRAKFDLNLTLTPTRAGTIEGSLEYDRDLFDARGVAAWASAFITLTTALAADPGAPITALPLLDADARAAALAAAAGPAVDLPAGRLTVPALFDAQVARDPHAIALIAGSQHLSYGDLDAAANRLARTLIARGVGPDDIVAILLDRSADLVIALLAILKAGAAYLPLDPQYPAERRGFMLRDSQARLLVTTTALRGDTPAPAAICLDDAADPGCGTRITDRDRRAPLLPGHLAYLIYTSGSTGTPKGVAVTHLSLAHQLLWMQSRHPSGAGRTMLGRTSIAFDASVWEIFSPLICGSRIVLVDSATLSDTARLAQTLAAHAVTDIQLVPSLIAPLAPALAGSPIRLVFAGGAILPRAEIERLSADCTASVINLYGPTEATVQVAHWQADHAPRPSASPHAPVGAPIWNTRIHILDASLEPLPAGVVGELYIAGIALARGYAGRPGLTAERFIACPFGPPGARMYRTGDLGRLDPDGQILLLGRADDQIKIRGFRVEPGEIEAAILALFPGQVTAADRRTGSAHRLIAYLVPPPGGSVPDAAAIRDALAARLPEYMIPSAFVPLAALPRLANGKLDRRALPDVAAADTGRIHRTPRTAREALLCRLFGELTGTGNVGPEDGFFSIGGDSISAIRLVSLARAAGLSLTVRDVFRHQTPGALRVRRTDCC
jgi:amino acid adenylation domain-containing protein